MEGIAIKRFSVSNRRRKRIYEEGETVDLPDNQFADFEQVGLVRAKPAKKAKAKSELPNPGNDTSNNGADE